MHIQTKVRRIGNSLGIVLPREVIQALRVKEGAALYITEAPESSLRLTPERKRFAEKRALADDLIHRYDTEIVVFAE